MYNVYPFNILLAKRNRDTIIVLWFKHTFTVVRKHISDNVTFLAAFQIRLYALPRHLRNDSTSETCTKRILVAFERKTFFFFKENVSQKRFFLFTAEHSWLNRIENGFRVNPYLAIS